jgi:hypothetical protein
MRALLTGLVTGFALLGCAGSQKGTDSDWSLEPETRTAPVRDVDVLSAAPDVAPLASRALVGVRHDLMLSAGPHEPRCNCLSVEVGPPDDPRFFWAGGAPAAPFDAVVVAIGARGIPCPGGDPDEVEDLAEGRPLASGAIIPRPGPKGGVFVYPRRATTVYGRGAGLNGSASRCRVR